MTKKAKKNILNIAFLLLLIGITVTVLFACNQELNFENIKAFLVSSNPWYIAIIFLCMILSIAFEGWSMHLIVRRLGYRPKMRSSMAYAAADVYYSAITPSASGGQPASAVYMMRDGVSGGNTAV
ncbi:MAG: flippase-like domain-containing protein, partial [Clostridiales bacterium]|nr:flippase-like domain-containing protein [Clostridiales bacterium]